MKNCYTYKLSMKVGLKAGLIQIREGITSPRDIAPDNTY